MRGPVLVDIDPEIDDALAFQYLVAAGGWDLKAITTVARNVPLPQAVANARGLAALLGIERDVHVYGDCPTREDFAEHFVDTLGAQVTQP
jgi:purine nucleosidase